jgi:serine/threonine-protein phosphatase 2B catalytic subunit
MLRGNHECRNMTDHFTFRSEVIDKFDEEVYELIMELFDCLPLCGLADKKYFITHGGISPELKKISKINKIDRFLEIPMDGIMWDLMWADPVDEKDAKSIDFADNRDRDWSYTFGRKPAKKLIDDNNLMTIVRAHQVQIEGYKMHRWDGPSSFPFVITIFSAPNYCDYYSNKGSVLILEEGNVSIKQFDSVEHPYNLPDQIDIFTWSMPFLIDKVLGMMGSVYSKWQDNESVDDESFKTATSDRKNYFCEC